MPVQWFYATGGQQAGPVTWEELKRLAEQKQLGVNDLVWNSTLPGWVEAGKVEGLFPPANLPTLPPPLPTPGAAQPSRATKVTGEVVLVGFGGGVLPGMMSKIEIKLGGKNLGTGTLQGGLRLPFETTTGTQVIELIVAGGALSSLLGGFGKKVEASASGRTYPVEFPTAGHYLVTLTPSGTRGLPPTGAEVALVEAAPQQLALAPVVEEEPEEGLVQKGLAAIGRGWQSMQQSARRSQLNGLWEPVGEGLWFLFTRDGGLLRADGFGAKYRWLDDDNLEVFEEGCETTVRFQVLSLGKHELLLKAGNKTGHFTRGVSITEAEERSREQEARRRMAEFRQQALSALGTVAAVLAVGGLAVLCGAAAAGVSDGGSLTSGSVLGGSSGERAEATATGSMKQVAGPTSTQAVALKGAVVVGQDGSRVVVQFKCEACGAVQPGRTTVNVGSGVTSGGFACHACKRQQQYAVQGR